MTHRETMNLMGCVVRGGKADGCMCVVRGPGSSGAGRNMHVEPEKSVSEKSVATLSILV